jgi:hypothetical protein
MTSPPAVEPLNSNRLPACHLEVCFVVSSAYRFAQDPLLWPKLQRLAISGQGGFGSLANGATNLRSRLSSAAVHGALQHTWGNLSSSVCVTLADVEHEEQRGEGFCAAALLTCPLGQPSAGRLAPASPCRGPWGAPLKQRWSDFFLRSCWSAARRSLFSWLSWSLSWLASNFCFSVCEIR